MEKNVADENIDQLLDEYLNSLPTLERELNSDEVEFGQSCKKILIEKGPESIPILLNRISNSKYFSHKDHSYDLIIEIGSNAVATLEKEIGKRDMVTDIWISGALYHLGSKSPSNNLWELTKSTDTYTKNLATLSLSFLYLDFERKKVDSLIPILIEALDDDRNIEGTTFSISGSSLGALVRISNIDLIAIKNDIILYNFEDFIFPPPIHPFPFFADHFSNIEDKEKSLIKEKIHNWHSN